MHSSVFEWAVIGAGPAGIAAVGELLDQGVSPQTIAWCDPQFQVGDLGQFWHGVNSNTKVKLFLQFLKACDAFHYEKRPHAFPIETLAQDKTCLLGEMVKPLQWITDELKQQVFTQQSTATELTLSNNKWHIKTDTQTLVAKKVILAIGSEPKPLKQTIKGLTTIPLEAALNPETLKQQCTKDDTVAVFGSSHSAMIILKTLIEANVKKIVNFYLSPVRFAIEHENWTLFDNTGLKGSTADWVREHITGTPPQNVTRLLASPDNIDKRLPECNKVIHAIGFNPRTLPVSDMEALNYNPTNGIIAPGLFGFGIAFPERIQDPLGHQEFNVGLWKFMKYIKRILPIWMNYHA